MTVDPVQELASERELLFSLLRSIVEHGPSLLLHPNIVEPMEDFMASPPGDRLRGTTTEKALREVREAVRVGSVLALASRPRVGTWRYVRIDLEAETLEAISVRAFLRLKEQYVGVTQEQARYTLEVDLGPFSREFPRMREVHSIGRGVEFLNRHLSRTLFADQQDGYRTFIDFLSLHRVGAQTLMLSERDWDLGDLSEALRDGIAWLAQQPDGTPWAEVAAPLAEFGIQPGWGADAGTARASMRRLLDILEAPDPRMLETFLSRMPMIFGIAIVSPHGFFGQSDVLGLPDTGGQVVYILDQVRALEQEMRRRIDSFGLTGIDPQIVVLTRLIPEARGTTCDQRLERIEGTEHARILRVPFRDADGEVLRPWVSRFDIYPYLERFAEEAGVALVKEMGRKPDFIVGNYTDGNLVATLLSHTLQVTQCHIAHALEKTKYLYSDLFWREHEESHRFSTQFTADLIAMNAADFIIASTYQELAGGKSSEGQYESYRAFTLPGLYRVVQGFDVFDPRLNIVSPGAAPELYFPFSQEQRRDPELTRTAERMLFGEPESRYRGQLADPDKPAIFTMARLDDVKNVTGLVEWYAQHEGLRELTNLVVVGGFIDADRSEDREEREQIHRMHHLFEQHGLEPHVRWLPRCTDRRLGGEIYRVVADRRGAFVQPARFEAFGLTVVEAMTSGLPTFATCFGGPYEIIEHGRSGFHIDPTHGDRAAALMCDFFSDVHDDPEAWFRISEAAQARIEERYTWSLYAQRMLDLSCLYGFWKYVTNLERRGTRRYLEMFYALQYRPMAHRIQPSR